MFLDSLSLWCTLLVRLLYSVLLYTAVVVLPRERNKVTAVAWPPKSPHHVWYRTRHAIFLVGSPDCLSFTFVDFLLLRRHVVVGPIPPRRAWITEVPRSRRGWWRLSFRILISRYVRILVYRKHMRSCRTWTSTAGASQQFLGLDVSCGASCLASAVGYTRSVLSFNNYTPTLRRAFARAATTPCLFEEDVGAPINFARLGNCPPSPPPP